MSLYKPKKNSQSDLWLLSFPFNNFHHVVKMFLVQFLFGIHSRRPRREKNYESVLKRELGISILDILFSSNHNIHKSSCGLCCCGFRPFNRKIFVKSIHLKSDAQKQRPHELLWMLWFDEKSISKSYIHSRYLDTFYEFSVLFRLI